LQGDVGSGKTMVIFAAMLNVVEFGSSMKSEKYPLGFSLEIRIDEIMELKKMQ